MDVRELPLGQLLARTRWDTHASGLAFDRKKTSLLAEQAQAFIAEQSLCVIAGPGPQAELLPSPSSVLPGLFVYRRPLPLLGLHVRQAFFHCPKYIKMRIPGLTAAVASPSEETWPLRRLMDRSQGYLSEPIRAYIAQRLLCFLCTVNRDGRCAVNHRGGAPGFLVTLSPDATAPRGIVLLPDFAGNGTFEAIGNNPGNWAGRYSCS